MGGDSIVGVQFVQDWAEDTTLGDTSVEDDNGGCGGANSYMLRSDCQEILDTLTKRGSKLQCLQYVDQLPGADGIKC